MFRFGPGFHGFIFIALLVRFIIIAAIVIFVRSRIKKSGGCRKSALGILDCKFANGEISEEVYKNRRIVLMNKDKI